MFLKLRQRVYQSGAFYVVGRAKEKWLLSIFRIKLAVFAILIVAYVSMLIPALFAKEFATTAVALKHFQLRLEANTATELIILCDL